MNIDKSNNLKIKAKIAMVVFSYYPIDTRVRREAEALADTNKMVDIFCLKRKSERFQEQINGVQIYRVPVKKTRRGKFQYIIEYSVFIAAVFFLLSVKHLLKRYHLIHIHNMPDFLVFTALLPRITGTKLLLDLHDPMPEVYMTKYSIDKSHPLIRLLLYLEKQSIKFANKVITPNKAFQELFSSRSCPRNKIHIIMNSPDEKYFFIKDKISSGNMKSYNRNFTIMFHGSILKRSGIDISLYAISYLRNFIPNIIFKVFGTGDYVDELLSKVKQLKLSSIVKYHGYVPYEQLPIEILNCDLGLISNEPGPFTEINLPTRIFEYLCIQKPVVVPKTRGILDYFSEESIFFHQPGNAQDLANVILKIYKNPEKAKKILANGITVYLQYRWSLQREYFIKIVEELIASH